MSVSRRGIQGFPDYEKVTVKAGVLEGATYPADRLLNAKTGEYYNDPRAGLPVASIAAALEYGVGQAHPRPFMQQTVAENKKQWSTAFGKLMQDGMTPRDAVYTVGLVMKEDIRVTITNWPADNSKEWAEVKGFNKGLVQTSHLLNSIESEVEGI